jgi:ribosomal protein L13
MKPWIVINAQNRIIGRYATEAAAIADNLALVNASMVTIQCGATKRKKTTKSVFPYNGGK